MTPYQWRTLGDAGQWMGVAFLICGIIIMLYMHVDIGTVLIVCGSLFFALATKCKYYGKMARLTKCKSARDADIKLVKEG
jgi:hypothetical protein